MKMNDLLYLDSEGHYGSASGMTFLDVSQMTEDEKNELEESLDKPSGLRAFTYKYFGDGDKSKPFLIEGSGIVVTKNMVTQMERILGE